MTLDKNFPSLRKLILIEALKDKSTFEISKQMGFNFDKCNRWLEDSKILKWDEFILLSETLGLNIDGAFEAIHFNRTEIANGNIFQHLKVHNSFETNDVAADYLDCHVSIAKRYAQGITLPNFELILKLIDYRPNFLATFIYRLFSGNIVHPELAHWVEQGIKNPKFLSKKTERIYIEAGLTLRQYKTRTTKTDEWLSNKLRIDIGTVREVLKDMVKAEILAWYGGDNYDVINAENNSQTSNFKEAIPLFQDINRKSIEMLEWKKNSPEASSRPGIIAAQVYSTSREAMEKINAVIARAYADIYKIRTEDVNPHDETCCLLMHVLPLTSENELI